MQENLRTLDDISFITHVRLLRRESLNLTELIYIKERLKKLGYNIEYGCCGTNNIRKIK